MIDGAQFRDERQRQTLNEFYSRGDCCDPCDLAISLGLRVWPSKEPRASIRDGILRFPNRANLDRRGLSVFLAIAEYLLPAGAQPGAVFDSALELALPFHVAKTCPSYLLPGIQPHFPPRLLQLAAMRHRGSGVMTKSAG